VQLEVHERLAGARARQSSGDERAPQSDRRTVEREPRARVTWTAISSGPRRGASTAARRGTGASARSARRACRRWSGSAGRAGNEPDRGRLAASTSAREHRRVVRHAQLGQHVEHLVGDRVAGRRNPTGAAPTARSMAAAPRRSAAGSRRDRAGQVVAVIERMVGDLAPGFMRRAESGGRLRASKVAADGEERQGRRAPAPAPPSRSMATS